MKELYEQIVEVNDILKIDGNRGMSGIGKRLMSNLLLLANELLTYKGGKVLYQYQHLLLWRFYSMNLESDLLITVFLANLSVHNLEFVARFDWSSIIGHDNEELNSILRRGIVDNHCHLGGSLPVFPSIWTRTMEDASFRKTINTIMHLSDELLEREMCIRRLFIQLHKENGKVIEEQSQNGPTSYYDERKFLFYTISELINENVSFLYYIDIFCEYLSIKEKIRGLFVQQKSEQGESVFFSINENRRKMLNLYGNTDELIRSRLNESLRMNFTDKIEIRIKMKSPEALYGCISSIERQINLLRLKADVKYIISFSRENTETMRTVYREQSKREEMRKRSEDFRSFIERYPILARRIEGIDISSREDSFNPEVYSELMCRDIMRADYGLKRMCHVGERYSDLLSGLRRIDECLLFYDLKAGDRLGHAVPIYEYVDKWYRNRSNYIKISKEEYLDNIAWLLCNIPNSMHQVYSVSFLQEEFQKIFMDLYLDSLNSEMSLAFLSRHGIDLGCSSVSICLYYEAFKIRNQSPEHIKQVIVEDNLVYDEAIPYLIAYLYYYSSDIQKKGMQEINTSLSSEYVNLIEIIQETVQERIRDRGVCIEVCPSSNILLNGVMDESPHPVVGLYEKCKTNTKLNNICFSINTDDMDVFSTSLANEYSLIAYSYETNLLNNSECINCRQDFYRWLNSIRLNSIQMHS